MKTNLPVSNTEIIFEDNQFMLTKTDTKGVITYANQDFITVSGFSEAELIGSSHNMVRHPDMPAEAFEDMWRNLKAQKPWTGMVKNRTKTGDFYWVLANAAPIIENGMVTGYLSARRKPSRQQVQAATDAYQLFKVGNANGLLIREGKVVQNTVFYKWNSKLQNISLSQRMAALVMLPSIAMAVQVGLSLSTTPTVHPWLTYAIPTITTILLLWLTNKTVNFIKVPLNASYQVLENISANKLDSTIEVQGSNEISQLLRGIKAMQTLLSANENAEKELAFKVKEQSNQFEGQLAAISNSTGVIEFSMNGKVIAVNDIFLSIIGFSRSELIGQHHSSLIDSAYKLSPEYRLFWEKLNRGESTSGQYSSITKAGNEVWLEASYNPLIGLDGKPYKVVKYATDITEQKIKSADFEGQITAIGKSQGVIELGLDGTVLKANQTYLNMLGYAENELVGHHVSIVLDQTFAKSETYRNLWDKLVNGGSDSGQYKRIAKDGREVWIQASYNPIYDLKGKPFKIVNYTIDITEAKLQAADNAGQISGIHKTQGVIEFDLTGKVLSVNKNFLNLAGYSEKEVVGNNHRMFVEPAYLNSAEYKAFWESLNRGVAHVGQVKRIGKGGVVIWMQSIYNPILDMNGKPFKVVKYATDITEQHHSAETLAYAVEETQAIIEEAKKGDLSSRVPLADKTGAIASLCDGVNALMDKMTEIIVQVREAGETINTAANEISSGNNDLSSRTEHQASSLEETAASMEQLASTVKNNAENAKQANQLAAAASGVAIKGGTVVGQVVNTMSDINSSAKKIEDIISVIDGIAFQTNILALNAAVEAARAGEQGRGFAVVAGEVRNLAQRSASAAKEIKELISDSVKKTAEGTAQVEQAGKTMTEIVSSVQRVTDIMGEITAASVEQSSGIDQVNQAVTSMDQVTQQNAALVEQAAAAAESLVDQANTLVEMVEQFKTKKSSGKASLKGLAPASTRNQPLRESRRVAAGAKESWEEF